MIRKLRDFVATLSAPPEQRPDADTVAFAMAALLVETARADFNIAASEDEELVRVLAGHLASPPAEAAALIARARAAVEKSVSLYEFTRPLHASLSYDEKLEFVRMLWRVALADQRLDKYEDYLVSKVCELLYVSRGDVIRLKHEVLKDLPAALGGD